MADDWLKVRKGLISHPKLVRIACTICATRKTALGALIEVWAIFDTHTEDGRLDGYTPDVLDQMVDQPRISEAMRAVGWLEYDPPEATPDQVQALVIPRFQTHNGKSAKRRALNAERMRTERMNTPDRAENVRSTVPDSCASDAHKKRTKRTLEKEKEYIEEGGLFSEPDLPFPDHPEFTDAWRKWTAYRSGIRKPVKGMTRTLQFKKLEEMGPARAAAAILHSIANGWTGIFEDRTPQNPPKNFGKSPPAESRPSHRVQNLPEPAGDWRAAVAADYGHIPDTAAWSSFPEEVQRDLIAIIEKGNTP